VKVGANLYRWVRVNGRFTVVSVAFRIIPCSVDGQCNPLTDLCVCNESYHGDTCSSFCRLFQLVLCRADDLCAVSATLDVRTLSTTILIVISMGLAFAMRTTTLLMIAALTAKIHSASKTKAPMHTATAVGVFCTVIVVVAHADAVLVSQRRAPVTAICGITAVRVFLGCGWPWESLALLLGMILVLTSVTFVVMCSGVFIAVMILRWRMTRGYTVIQ
jgi:hypothetical protein